MMTSALRMMTSAFKMMDSAFKNDDLGATIRDQELSNQARMVETFSAIVLGGEAALDPQWPMISLMTQEVVDALQISWQEEGRKIML